MFRQFMKFGAVGVVNTLLFYVLFLIFSTLVRPTTGYYAAYLLSMIFAVFLNLKFTFEKQASVRKFVFFILVYLFSMYIGGLVLAALLGFSISVPLAGLSTICFTVVINFLGLKAVAKWA